MFSYEDVNVRALSIDNETVDAFDSEAQNQVEPQSISGATLFLTGIVVGYLIDGVVIWATGHSAAEWTAIGLQNLSNYTSNLIDAIQFSFTNKGETFQHALNDMGCTWSGPAVGGVWYCPSR